MLINASRWVPYLVSALYVLLGAILFFLSAQMAPIVARKIFILGLVAHPA
jgi:hypothetical protein